MNQLSRRAVLRLLGTASVGMSAACVSIPSLGGNKNSDHEPGALVVENLDSLAHIVSVSVTASESAKSENVSREVHSIIKNGREGQIPIEPKETKVYPDFLSGSMMYTVELSLGSSKTGTTPKADSKRKTIRFNPAATDVPDARGSFLTAQIDQNGGLSSHVSYVNS